MGFKFQIEYKSGASNRVADALSCRDPDPQADEAALVTMYARPLPAIMATIKVENEKLPDLMRLHQAVTAGTAPIHVSVADGILFFKHRLYLSRDSAVRIDILEESHSVKTAGHLGEKRTFARVVASFYWPG